jgi:hypothetical protein
MSYDYMTEEEEFMSMGADATSPIGDQAPVKHQSSKYTREIKPSVYVDVYDVLKAWNVTNPALQHLIKKALQAGNRGHKDLETDMQDIIDSAIRAKELEVK